MKDFNDIISRFQVEGEVTEVMPLGHGTVNQTYRITCGGRNYVLQEMNHSVYRYPTVVMKNIFAVTEYLRDVIAQEGRDPELETLTYIRTKAGNQLLQTDSGSYYRLYRMIDCAEELSRPETAADAYELGMILGQFQRRLRGYPVQKLSLTIPYLHDTEYVKKRLISAVRSDICMRASECQEQIEFVLDRSRQLSMLQNAVDAGEIPLRVTHNDMHYSNVLVDTDTKRAICLIDLDTVMPGVSILDFGDSVRAGAVTFDEDDCKSEPELDLDKFRSHLTGYLSEMGKVLTDKEKEMIGQAIWTMAMENGMRYLTAYLNGEQIDSEITEDSDNLCRAINQFLLVLDIEDKLEQIHNIIVAVCAKH